MKHVCKCDKCGQEAGMTCYNGIYRMPEQWIEVGWPRPDRVLCSNCSKLYSVQYVGFLKGFFGRVYGNELTKILREVTK